ncbi:hypothetical protein B0H17DRAFT_1135846 [Mycena rosella]|uniref:Uncharacterized protein n=1 Tax=Mycena rosella TaxID=1033263 RepID=A0AAD7GCI2_MYCRO|nr:hypothetical protein B0H17DRAFT_1135846 [Mycena rosella]
MIRHPGGEYDTDMSTIHQMAYCICIWPALARCMSSVHGDTRLIAVAVTYDIITTAARQRGLNTNSQNPATVYQTILKERWDALSGEAQAEWNERADTEAGDVSQTQEEFAPNIQLALRNLCQGRFLGDAEMVMFYAFRESDSGDLVAGTIHGHSKRNTLNFGGTNEELQLRYENAWSEFAENTIPPNNSTVGLAYFNSLNPSIPRSSSGYPMFPSINLNTVALDDIRALLYEYFDQCWAHRGLSENVMSIPWEDLALNPGKYYDTTGSYFSMALDNPQSLSTIQVLTLAQDILAHSGVDSPTPFRFLQPHGVVLIPSTPSAPPPRSPSPAVNLAPTSPLAPSTPVFPPKQPTPTPPPASTPPAVHAEKPKGNGKARKRPRDAHVDDEVDGSTHCVQGPAVYVEQAARKVGFIEGRIEWEQWAVCSHLAAGVASSAADGYVAAWRRLAISSLRPPRRSPKLHAGSARGPLNAVTAKKIRRPGPKDNELHAPPPLRKSSRTSQSKPAAHPSAAAPESKKKKFKWRGWAVVDSDGNEHVFIHHYAHDYESLLRSSFVVKPK